METITLKISKDNLDENDKFINPEKVEIAGEEIVIEELGFYFFEKGNVKVWVIRDGKPKNSTDDLVAICRFRTECAQSRSPNNAARRMLNEEGNRLLISVDASQGIIKTPRLPKKED